MDKKIDIGFIVKLVAVIVAIAATVCVIVVYSSEILAFISKIKEKIQSKLPCSHTALDDEFADYEEM